MSSYKKKAPNRKRTFELPQTRREVLSGHPTKRPTQSVHAHIPHNLSDQKGKTHLGVILRVKKYVTSLLCVSSLIAFGIMAFSLEQEYIRTRLYNLQPTTKEVDHAALQPKRGAKRNSGFVREVLPHKVRSSPKLPS